MKKARRWIMVSLLLAAFPAPATTWGEETIKDPISGKNCKVSMPASSGSYVYHWPEKYDQVFWPLTDPMGIWICPVSGFASFIGDIELKPDEKSAIAAFLKGALPLAKAAEPGAVLERLEAVYALRTLAPDAKSRIVRALAYQYQSNGRQAKADALRAQAGAIMEQRLGDADLDPALRLQYLFVTANYARELGLVAESDRKLEQLASLLAEAAHDEKRQGYAEYLGGLIASSRNIAPGGALAPAE